MLDIDRVKVWGFRECLCMYADIYVDMDMDMCVRAR